VEKERQRGASHFLSNIKRGRRENYFSKHYRDDLSPWFNRLEMNRQAFMSAVREQTLPVLEHTYINLIFCPHLKANVVTEC
jgi:hypothetical protein